MVDPVLTPEEECEVLAAELALGVLDGEALAAALRRRMADPAFAADVAAWEARLAAMADDVAEAEGADVWAAVAQRIAAPSGEPVSAPLPTAANDAGDATRPWRWGTYVASAVAAALAVILIGRPPQKLPVPVEVVRAPEQVVVAQLGGADAAARLAANYDPAAGAMRVRAIAMPQSKLVPELWVIPAGGKPLSLGIVSASGTTEVTLSTAQRDLIADGATLAITMEPLAGAPHAAPSSAPVAAGIISVI